jgi:hypothetical protein
MTREKNKGIKKKNGSWKTHRNSVFDIFDTVRKILTR